MRHIFLGPTRVRAGLVKGFFCYQPFAAGRLGKAIALFRDLGTAEANEAFFAAHYAVVVSEKGDILVERRWV